MAVTRAKQKKDEDPEHFECQIPKTCLLHKKLKTLPKIIHMTFEMYMLTEFNCHL